MSAIPPLSEDKPTSGERAATAAFDPRQKSLLKPMIARKSIDPPTPHAHVYAETAINIELRS